MRAVTVTMLALVLVAFVSVEYLSLSVHPLSDAYGVSRGNPLGLFTASFVFDGWGNVEWLVYASFLMLVSALLLPRRWRLPSSTSFLLVANLAGPLACAVFLASPDSAERILFIGPREIVTWPEALGMSVSAYAALAFSFVIGALAVFRGWPQNSGWESGRRVVFWRVGFVAFGLMVLLGASAAFTAFSQGQMSTYHVVGFLAGLSSAAVLMWRIGVAEREALQSGALDAVG